MDCYRLRNSSDVFSDLLVARIVTTVVSSASTPCCVVTSPVAMLHVAVRPERLGASNGWPVPKEGAGPEGCEANRGSCQARPPRRAARVSQLMRTASSIRPGVQYNGAARRPRTSDTKSKKQPCLQTQRNTSILSHIHDDR